MKKLTIALCLAIAFAAPTMVLAQGPTWTSDKIEKYNGYDYELWNQDNQGTVSMKLTGDNGTAANAVGGTFESTWSGTKNVLFRSGRKFTGTSGQSVDGGGTGKTASAYGNISIDFAATWSSGDDVKMLGVYGWAFYTLGSVPTKQENGTSSTFSNQIEYYIIQDRGSYNSATGGTNSKKYGEATIDGIAYEFRVCDRIGQPMLTGNGNFKQYFSVPKSTISHRTSGTISVSKHFEEWEKAGMKMDGPLYEVAMKVESYSGSGNSSGNAKVTKNILTVGGTTTNPSSSSGGSTVPDECGEYKKSFCGGLGYGSVYSNLTAIPSMGDCLYIGDFEVIQPALNSTVAINGVENTCGDDWADCPYNDKPATTKDGGYYVYVKTGSINSYENNGWKNIVAKAKPACTTPSSSSNAAPESSSSSEEDPDPILKNRIPLTHFSVQTLSDKALRIEVSSPSVVEIFNLKGNKVTSLKVSGSQNVKLSLPSGVYFAKASGTKSIRFVLK